MSYNILKPNRRQQMIKKTKSPAKKSVAIVRSTGIPHYFAELAKSPKVRGFRSKLAKIEATAIAAKSEELPAFRESLKTLSGLVELERQKISKPVTEISKGNQGVFKPILDNISAAVTRISARYEAYVAEGLRIAREAARKAEAEARRVAEEARRVAEELRKKNEKAEEEGREPEPEPPPPPPPPPPPAGNGFDYAKSAAAKKIDIEVVDMKAFLKYLVNEYKQEELWDAVTVAGTSIFQKVFKRNPGETEIPGIKATYRPSLEAYKEP